MNVSEKMKIEIKEYLTDTLDGILREMGGYLDKNIKRQLDDQAIQILATNHNQNFDEMEINIRGNGDFPFKKNESIFGGEEAIIYFQLLIDEVQYRISIEKELLKEAICTNFKYCEKKKAGTLPDDDFAFAIALADSLIMFQTKLPFPPATIVAYLIKKGNIGSWCECE